MVDRKLGRGLDFFLSSNRQQPAAKATNFQQTAEAPQAAAPAAPPGDAVQMVPVGQLAPNPYQPRKHVGEEELKALADSIRASGILQPILARKVGDHFEIVAGERRWRAAQLAQLQQVPVLVRAITDQESSVFALVENLQREDLNAIDKAQAFRSILAQLQTTQEELARKVGLDRSTVTNFLRLLDLPEEVQAHVSRGTLSMGHARALLGLGDPEVVTRVADEAIRQSLSVRALEAKVKDLQQAQLGTPKSTTGAAAGTKSRPVWLNEIEENLVESLGTSVAVRYGKKRSQVIIECVGRDEFERIYQRLKNSAPE